jgi:hypothetical protein
MSRTCTSKRGFFTSVHPYFNHTATPYRSLFGGPDGGAQARRCLIGLSTPFRATSHLTVGGSKPSRE